MEEKKRVNKMTIKSNSCIIDLIRGIMEFSFLHIADLHLGRAFSDLSEINNKIDFCSQACNKAFNKIIELAIEKQVSFILISGDSFDSDEHDLSAKLLFLKNLKLLAKKGIKSFVICGNHDSLEMYKKFKNYFNKDFEGLINITGVTTADYKHSFSPIEGVKIHSISFKTDEGKNPTEDLPKISAGDNNFNIGLIHCDLDKTSSKYAPCSKEDLRNLGYDYYALGHIHVPQDCGDNIIYAGTPQARTKKETGTHGCYYIKVNDKNISKEFIPTDFVRFNSQDIDCSNYENKIEIYNAILDSVNNIEEDVELNLFEINLIGISKAFEELNDTDNLLEEYLENYSQSENKNISVYKINNKTIPLFEDYKLTSDTGVIGLIANCFEKNSEINTDKIYSDICEIHENIYKKLKLDTDSAKTIIDSLETDKDEIINNVKNEIKSLCNEIYSME